jgi:hypothetical protein
MVGFETVKPNECSIFYRSMEINNLFIYLFFN